VKSKLFAKRGHKKDEEDKATDGGGKQKEKRKTMGKT
jgi:hypothetical protein